VNVCNCKTITAYVIYNGTTRPVIVKILKRQSDYNNGEGINDATNNNA